MTLLKKMLATVRGMDAEDTAELIRTLQAAGFTSWQILKRIDAIKVELKAHAVKS